jgi:hypothetical protein
MNAGCSKFVTLLFTAALGLFTSRGTATAQSAPNVQLAVVPGTEANPGAHNVPLYFTLIGDTANPSCFDLSAEADLWALDFCVPPGATCATPPPTIHATPTGSSCTYNSFQLYTMPNNSSTPTAFLAVWNGGHHSSMPSGETFTVYVYGIAAPGANVYELQIQVVPSTPSLTLKQVEFPRINVLSRNHYRGTSEMVSELLTIANAQGVAIMAPLKNLSESISWPFLTHPGRMSMQWLSYYSTSEPTAPAPVLFFGTRDPTGYAKQFMVGPRTDDRFDMSIVHYPANNTTVNNGYLSPYTSTLGVVRGDWYDAAQEYRTWLFSCIPSSRPIWLTKANHDYLPPLGSRNPAHADERPLPPQLLNADMLLTYDNATATPRDFSNWQTDAMAQLAPIGGYGATIAPSIIYHGHSINVPAAESQGWGDWQLWDSGFLQAAATYNATNWGPYINFDVYDVRAQSYPNPNVTGFSGSVAQYLLTDYGGCAVDIGTKIPRLCHAFANTAQPPQRFCGEFMKQVALDAQSRGAHCIYLDEYTYDGGGVPCYGTNHGHPVGGGSYMTLARRANVDDMLTATRGNNDPEFFASSEAPGEAFSDVVELAFEHTSPDLPSDFARSVPLYSAVYHDYELTSRILNISNNPANTFANWLTRRAIAYSGYFGDLPSGGNILNTPYIPLGTNNQPNTPFAQSFNCLKGMISVAQIASVRPLFHTGRRMRDVRSDVSHIPTPQGGVILSALVDPSGDQPVVYLSTWQDPSTTNQFGIMATNWTDVGDTFPPSNVLGGAQTLHVTLDATSLGVPSGTYNPVLVTPSGETPLPAIQLAPQAVWTVTVPALTTMFFRFTHV